MNFIGISLLLFVLLFLIPVNVIPGNEIAFQAVLFGWKDYIFLGALALLGGLVATLQVFIFKQRYKAKIGISTGAVGGLGILSGIFSSIFATATCSLCVGALFGFLGAGGVLFFVSNRIYVIMVSLILLYISLYVSAKKLNGVCGDC